MQWLRLDPLQFYLFLPNFLALYWRERASLKIGHVESLFLSINYSITPIHDPDHNKDITINSCLSKYFNLLLTKRLTSFVNEKDILKYNQIGFWKGFDTADHVLRIKTLCWLLRLNSEAWGCISPASFHE